MRITVTHSSEFRSNAPGATTSTNTNVVVDGRAKDIRRIVVDAADAATARAGQVLADQLPDLLATIANLAGPLALPEGE